MPPLKKKVKSTKKVKVLSEQIKFSIAPSLIAKSMFDSDKNRRVHYGG